MHTLNTRKSPLAVAAALCLLACAGTARADDAGSVDLKRVVITGTLPVADVAPSGTSLLATQPQSNISRDYIEHNASIGSNYADIVSIAPSVMSVDPNGAGLMESQSLTLRGFQDGQYNVTLDGIPWGDSNDFTHHSTVYFMPQDLEGISIDRGPGDASTFGNATFGGTIGMNTRALGDVSGSSAALSYGSWNTAELDVEHHGGGGADGSGIKSYVSAKVLRSDGFLTNSGQERQNLFAKLQKDVSADTTITGVVMINHNAQNTPYGSTLAQQAKYGYNFGLTNDPASEANAAWNRDQIRTDFAYVGVKTVQSGWNLDNKLYTYGYVHDGYYGWNTGSVTLADTQADGGTSHGPNNVPGGRMFNNYHSVGDMFNASRPLGPGRLGLGLWYDYQHNDRFEQQVDWTLGGAPNAASGTVVDGAWGPGVDRDMYNKLVTTQAYAKYDWNVTRALTLDVGGRYASFERQIDAMVNQKTLQPYSASATWTKFLPSATLRYTISPRTSAYVQYAQGFLAPNMNVFYKKAPNLDSVQPTTTKNYQAGLNWSTDGYNGGVDIYRVDSTNLASGAVCPAGMVGTCYNVSSAVRFQGVEVEGSARVGGGFSVYGNFAINNYATSDGSVLQNTPKDNGALGLIYRQGPWYGSLMDKIVSSRFSNTDAAGNNIVLGGYAIANLSMGYRFQADTGFVPRGTKLSLKVNNLFDRKGLLASLNSDVNGNPLFFVLPGRDVQVGIDVPF